MEGRTSFLHFINHSSHSSLWKTCPQGKILTTSPRWNESIQIAHSSFEKYFCDFDFVLTFPCLEVEVEGTDSRSAISEEEIGGGGGSVEVDVTGRPRTEECIEWNGGREAVVGDLGVGNSGSEDESSFSHTISGVQILSGKERTTMGGALSASRCLPVSLTPRRLR